jgi:hypothetical protein
LFFGYRAQSVKLSPFSVSPTIPSASFLFSLINKRNTDPGNSFRIKPPQRVFLKATQKFNKHCGQSSDSDAPSCKLSTSQSRKALTQVKYADLSLQSPTSSSSFAGVRVSSNIKVKGGSGTLKMLPIICSLAKTEIKTFHDCSNIRRGAYYNYLKFLSPAAGDFKLRILQILIPPINV